MKEATYRCASALAATSHYVGKAAAEQAVALALPMLERRRRIRVADGGGKLGDHHVDQKSA